MGQVPFSRDGNEARHLRPRYDGQAPFVDTMDSPSMDAAAPTSTTTSPPGVAATPGGNPDVPADQEGSQPLPLQAPLPDPEQDIEVFTPPGLDSIVPTPSPLEFPLRNGGG